MQFKLNSDVKFILEKLNKNGTGFLVGGAVRDLLSGKEPDDYDFATDIDYEKLKNIFADYLPKEVGASFGILIIKVNNKNYEIAKFRKESGILNSRHPSCRLADLRSCPCLLTRALLLLHCTWVTGWPVSKVMRPCSAASACTCASAARQMR